MSVNVLYRTAATATGGRDGHAATADGSLDVKLTTPKELGGAGNLDMKSFFLSNMIETFGHAIVLRRPAGLSLARAKAEILQAILGYLKS